MLHDKLYGAASFPAGEALAQVLGRRHYERWSPVIMEWAQPLEVSSTPLERDEVRHHIHDVGGIQYLVYRDSVDHSRTLSCIPLQRYAFLAKPQALRAKKL